MFYWSFISLVRFWLSLFLILAAPTFSLLCFGYVPVVFLNCGERKNS